MIKYSMLICFSYANLVSIGDEILAEAKTELVPVKVINISSLAMQGISNFLPDYNPLNLSFSL